MKKSSKKPSADLPKTPVAPEIIPNAMPDMGNDIADVGNIDKIRDILFGNQTRDYDKRFVRMENQLTQEAAELKSELLKRIDSLEVYIKQEIKDINQRLKNETNERADSITMVQRELKEAVESLNKKLLQEEENLADKSTELRNQILDQSKQLSDDIMAKYDKTSSNLKMTAEELDDAKVNRSDLSGFFLDLAMRVSGDEGGMGNSRE